MRLIVLVGAFVGFSVWSLSVALQNGAVGFLTLALERPWAAQMLIDLGISLFVAWTFMRPDATERGINPLPYQLATVALGSIAVLAYLVHREVVLNRESARSAASPRA